jgi:ribonuclease J
MIEILPLGGLGEVGKNCMAIASGQRAIVVDCGMTFQHADLGVERITPSFDALEHYHLEGIFLTHGHEDHIGALPHLLERFDVPVYGPHYAIELLRRRAHEFEVLNSARLQAVRAGERIQTSTFEVEPISVAHSIVDAFALAIETERTRVVHSGDFKIDGPAFDLQRFEALGRDNVDLLLSDSTNALESGSSRSEREVAESLEGALAEAEHSVFVSLFASNGVRLKALVAAATRLGRTVFLVGRSMQNHARLCADLGILSLHSAQPLSRAEEFPRARRLYLVTGSQAEPDSALAKIARGDHPEVRIERGDTVVFSSRVIPGHELAVANLEDELARLGARLVTPREAPGIHASGHAKQDELSTLIDAVAPRGFLPIHGNYRMLLAHAALAEAHGAKALVVENGTAANVETGGLLVAGKRFTVGNIYRTPTTQLNAHDLHERRQLAMLGHASVLVTLCPASVTIRLRGLSAVETAVLERTCLAEVLRAEAQPSQESLIARLRSILRAQLPRGQRGYRIEPEIVVG